MTNQLSKNNLGAAGRKALLRIVFESISKSKKEKKKCPPCGEKGNPTIPT